MELVQGEDLSAMIARGALPLPDALPIGRKIAEAPRGTRRDPTAAESRGRFGSFSRHRLSSFRRLGAILDGSALRPGPYTHRDDCD